MFSPRANAATLFSLSFLVFAGCKSRDAEPRLPEIVEAPIPEDAVKVHLTVYYTPRESGFSAEKGYDMTPTTKPGLNGRTYPKDFIRSVMKEGIGRVNVPVNGKSYLCWGRTNWSYSNGPVGNRDNLLVPRRSAAVSKSLPLFAHGKTIVIHSPEIRRIFGNIEWQVADVGLGVESNQIDLYWGEDDPMSPEQLARPAGTTFQHAYEVPVTLK